MYICIYIYIRSIYIHIYIYPPPVHTYIQRKSPPEGGRFSLYVDIPDKADVCMISSSASYIHTKKHIYVQTHMYIYIRSMYVFTYMYVYIRSMIRH